MAAPRSTRATIHSVADAVSDDPPPETDAGDVAAAGGAKPGTADAAASPERDCSLLRGVEESDSSEPAGVRQLQREFTDPLPNRQS